MLVDWTFEIPGTMRSHLLRVEFDFDLGRSGRITGGPSSLSVAEKDFGEAGAVAIRRAWSVIERDGKPIRERAIWSAALMRLKEDEKLAELLYKSAIDGMPRE